MENIMVKLIALGLTIYIYSLIIQFPVVAGKVGIAITAASLFLAIGYFIYELVHKEKF